MPLLRVDQIQQFAAINVLSDGGYHRGHKIIPNCAMVRLDWTLTDGKVGHNVMYSAYTGGTPLSASMADGVKSTLVNGATWTNMAAHIAPTTFLKSVTLLDMRSLVGQAFVSTAAPTAGASAGTALPEEVAICCTFLTGTRGPSGRGRIFLPGWANSALGAGGVILPALVNAIGAWLNTNLQPALASGPGPLVLGLPQRDAYTSPKTGTDFDARPATTLAVTSTIVKDNHWDSQRRRGLR